MNVQKDTQYENYTKLNNILYCCYNEQEDGVGTPVRGEGGHSSPNVSICAVVVN